MSGRRAARGSGSKRGAWRRPWLFLGGLALLVVAAWFEGPVLARQVWHEVGVRRVEGHAEVLREAARESGIDVNVLAGLVYVESRGNVAAESGKGALGLFQLMPAAASDAAKRLRVPVPSRAELLTDARLNARLGANHFARLVQLLGPDLERVLVAYNAGRGRLTEWEDAAGGWVAWRDGHRRRGDSATLAYAEDVLTCAARFRERGVLAPPPGVPEPPPPAGPQR